MERWNLPDDPYERQQRVAEIADELCDRYDQAYFESMNKILEKVRANIAHIAISNSPDLVIPPESELPKTL